jgi:CubicO group peptidase (beta-lactamase class C family)
LTGLHVILKFSWRDQGDGLYHDVAGSYFIFSFDIKAIDEYVESKMRLPRIPGVAVAIVKVLADKQMSFPPGQGFEYSNANYETLGLIIQTVSGMSYEDYVSQNILRRSTPIPRARFLIIK